VFGAEDPERIERVSVAEIATVTQCKEDDMLRVFLGSIFLGVHLFAGVFSPELQAIEPARTTRDVYRELRSWIELQGDTHIYPGPRLRDDFFCFRPADCRTPPGEPDPVNPLMDHLAELTDEFIVGTFQETLGSNQSVFAGRTLKGEPCVVDLQSLRIDAEIGGKPYGDYFRLDWNEDGAWHRYQIKDLTPHSIQVISQPDLLTRAVQRLFSPRQSAQQRFQMTKLGAGKLRVSLWVNTSQPEHVLDWRRKKVVCEF